MGSVGLCNSANGASCAATCLPGPAAGPKEHPLPLCWSTEPQGGQRQAPPASRLAQPRLRPLLRAPLARAPMPHQSRHSDRALMRAPHLLSHHFKLQQNHRECLPAQSIALPHPSSLATPQQGQEPCRHLQFEPGTHCRSLTLLLPSSSCLLPTTFSHFHLSSTHFSLGLPSAPRPWWLPKPERHQRMLDFSV